MTIIRADKSCLYLCYCNMCDLRRVVTVQVTMWLVGGKRLSRRSRSMRSESTSRRKAAAAAFAGQPAPPLGPSALLQSAEPASQLQENSFDIIGEDVTQVDLDDSKSIIDSNGRDSGVHEGNLDSSEENYNICNKPETGISQKTNEHDLSLSSASTISENLHCSTSTPPSSPKSAHGTPITRSKFIDEMGPQVCSEPDLRSSILVSSDSKRLSLGSSPDECFGASSVRKVKKRVTIR